MRLAASRANWRLLMKYSPFGLVLLLVFASTAKADVDFNQTFPSVLTTSNPCNGDVVVLEGQTHVLAHSTEAASGNQHFYIDLSSAYQGVGAPSTLTYSGNNTLRDEFSTEDPFPITHTTLIDLMLQSQTGADNYYLRIHLHMTFNADGTLTADFTDSESRCNG